jgi:hypothetical protein
VRVCTRKQTYEANLNSSTYASTSADYELQPLTSTNDPSLSQMPLTNATRYEISDPSDLAQRVYRLMSKQLGVDPDEPVKEIEIPDEEEQEEADEEDGADEDEVRGG